MGERGLRNGSDVRCGYRVKKSPAALLEFSKAYGAFKNALTG